MNILKRIGAYLLVAALVIGALPISSLRADVDAAEPSVLTIVNGSANSLNLKGTDSLWSAEGNIWKELSAADSESGVFLNGSTSPYWIVKHNGQNCWYGIYGMGTDPSERPAEAGDTLTIKGTFKNGENTVTFEESTFRFDGTEWSKVVAQAEPSVLTIVHGNANALHLQGTDSQWGTEGDIWKELSAADSESGFFLNGSPAPYRFIKYHGQNCYYGIYDMGTAAGERPAEAGDTLTIKGTFKNGEDTITFEESTFVFDGSAWSKKVNDTTEFTVTSFGDVVTKPTFVAGANAGEGNWHVYVKTDTAIPSLASGDYFTGLQIAINGGEPVGVVAFADGAGGLIFYIPETAMSSPLSADTTVVLKAGEAVAHTGGQKIKLTQDFPMYYTHADAAWSLTPQPTYTDFAFASITSLGYNAAERWDMFLKTSASLPGTAAAGQYFTGLKAMLQVNEGQEQEINVNVWHEADKTVWVPIYALTQDLQAGEKFKLTIKAGTADCSDTSVGSIKLTEDFTIYRNEFGWSNEGFIQPPSYDAFTFTEVTTCKFTAGTGADDGRWDVFLKASNILPGTAGAGQYFTGLKAKLQVNDGEAQDINVNVWNEAEATVWVPVYKLTQDLGENDKFKLTFAKGQADSNTAGVEGIELAEDFTIYVNKYGVSTEGFAQKPVYDKLTFTGFMKDSKCVENSDGQGNDMWSFLMTTSKSLSIKPGEGSYSGLKAKLEVGGELREANITLVSEEDKVGWFSIWSPTLNKEDEKKGIKLTIQKGTADASVKGCHGIELTEDFVLYINQYGWSTEGFMKEPTYTKFAFTGMNNTTGLNAKEKAWDLYLTPSKKLPGKADYTMFTGLQMSVNGGKAFDINVVKSAHAGTAFIRVSTDKIPEDITKNMKIVIKAKKANSTDGYGIQLTKDFTIYANKYGWSTSNYLSAPKIKQKGAELTLDRGVAYGGTVDGIYLKTTDIFPIDTSWTTHIKALGYDAKSGVFLNGEKLKSASIIRYIDGKCYISLSDIGLKAKDHDKLTIKGTFALNGTGVTYKEATFHFNGKIWGTKYEAPKPEKYTDIKIESIDVISAYSAGTKQWNLYLHVDKMLPGEIDSMMFHKLTVQVGKKSFTTWVSHAYNHTLYVPISAEYLPENCKDGTAVTIKAGKALGVDQSSGIRLTKDFTFYTYKGTAFTEKPTKNTQYQEVNVSGMVRAGAYNEDAMMWQCFLKLQQDLTTESGTRYLQLPVEINGKEYKITATQEEIYLYLAIPSSILPGNTKSATVKIKAGATATANAGKDGIRFKEDWTAYAFNKAISEVQYTEVQKIDLNITGVQAVTQDPTLAHVYIKTNKEFPGDTWYEYYNDFVYYYNGKKIESFATKADSTNNRLFYFPLYVDTVGLPKEGDTIEIKDGTNISLSGFDITFAEGIKMIFRDGVWSESVKSDAKKPADVGSLWSIARFNSEYIPTTTDGSVLFSGDDEYPEILSTEKLKDYTISFSSKKAYDDELATGFKVVLRGTPISDTEPMTPTLLNGYVITFSPMEVPNPENPEETVWSGYLELWKNGENTALTDMYRLAYEHERYNHPFFEYDKEYNYEFSIYNVTETCVCIEASVNGKTIMRYYDEASGDPFDPAINAGTFGVYGTGPNYIKDDIVELEAVIAEKDECVIGEEVRVAATYPSVIEDAEFTVNGKGATITDGVFKAEKAGTYTISCIYKGKELAPKTITVTKAAAAEQETEASSSFPVLPVAIGGGVVVLAAAVATVFIIKRKKQNKVAGE